jgi:hypothetical protein
VLGLVFFVGWVGNYLVNFTQSFSACLCVVNNTEIRVGRRIECDEVGWMHAMLFP